LFYFSISSPDIYHICIKEKLPDGKLFFYIQMYLLEIGNILEISFTIANCSWDRSSIEIIGIGSSCGQNSGSREVVGSNLNVNSLMGSTMKLNQVFTIGIYCGFVLQCLVSISGQWVQHQFVRIDTE